MNIFVNLKKNIIKLIIIGAFCYPLLDHPNKVQAQIMDPREAEAARLEAAKIEEEVRDPKLAQRRQRQRESRGEVPNQEEEVTRYVSGGTPSGPPGNAYRTRNPNVTARFEPVAENRAENRPGNGPTRAEPNPFEARREAPKQPETFRDVNRRYDEAIRNAERERAEISLRLSQEQQRLFELSTKASGSKSAEEFAAEHELRETTIPQLERDLKLAREIVTETKLQKEGALEAFGRGE